MDTKEISQDIAGKGVSYNLKLYRLQSAVDNAVVSLQRAAKIVSSLIEEQAEGKEDRDDR